MMLGNVDDMLKHHNWKALAAVLFGLGSIQATFAENMDEEWGERAVVVADVESERGRLFREGNYAMFIHWGLYSHLAGKWRGNTYYGIGEWIIRPPMADIPIDEYKAVAKEFNPVKFDARAIARLAKDAGMKYIIITAKHHDSFAMYHSKVCDFNIVDSTPFGRDPMLELAEAARAEGLGFGFYYSHAKDWTTPGGNNGPTTHPDGTPATFDEYFETKSLPQIEELTSGYGPLELMWFDTPGRIELPYVKRIIEVVRRNQPNALINSRVGAGQGDYASVGDMEVPRGNIDGLWETVDTTNDSWSYTWYDQNWKSPHEILSRLISTVGRGGVYMLNIGPRGDGTVPESAARALRSAGEWIRRYPLVIYEAGASPWGHALPWGDVTTQDRRLHLSIYNMPQNRIIHLPGLKTEIKSVSLFENGEKKPLTFTKERGWTLIQLPPEITETLIPVIEVELAALPEVDRTWGIDPSLQTTLLTEFSNVVGATLDKQSWKEKFGEWKFAYRAHQWQEGGKASWEIDVLEPGDYHVDLSYSGEGRLVWRVEAEGKEGRDGIQNEQNSSHNYQAFPIGWIRFEKPGRYVLNTSCIGGNREKASLKAIHLRRVDF